MVSLIGISFNLAAWLTHRIYRTVVRALPEESLEMNELKRTLTSEMENISAQVKSQSVAKLLAAESFLRQGNVHLLYLLKPEGYQNELQAPVARDQEQSEEDRNSLKQTISWFRRATESATEAFMDKQNVNAAQRLAALKIMIFCANIEHYDSPEKAELAVRNVMIDMSNDQEFTLMLQNKGEKYFGLTKDRVWRDLTQFICEVSFLISELRILSPASKELQNIDEVKSMTDIRKIVQGWGIPSPLVPLTFPEGVRTVGNFFVKTFYGTRIIGCRPPGKALVHCYGTDFAIVQFATLQFYPVSFRESSFESYKAVQPFENVAFCVTSDKKMIERIKFRDFTFQVDSDNRFDISRCLQDPQKQLFSAVGTGKKCLALTAQDNSYLHIIFLKTGTTKDYPLSSDHRASKLLCAKQVNTDRIEIAICNEQTNTITRMALDTASGVWNDIQVIKIPGITLAGALSGSGDLLVLASDEKSGEIRLGVHAKYSDIRQIELTCRLWKSPKIKDSEALAKSFSMCLSDKEGLVYVGMCPSK